MNGDGTRRQRPADLPDAALWRYSRAVDAVEDEAERLLDLAGFADGVLDADDHERVAEWVAGDPDAAGDVAAARVLAAAGHAPAPAPIVARALELVGGLVGGLVGAKGGSGGTGAADVIPLRRRPRALPGLREAARWGTLVAAMVVVGWLGFTLGMDASLSVARISQPGDAGFLQELLAPSTGFLRDANGGAQT